jgi:hypothetical protein
MRDRDVNVECVTDGNVFAFFEHNGICLAATKPALKIYYKAGRPMINRRRNRITSSSSSSALHIWTVVSLVGDRIYSSIHSSEHDAYREAVSCFEAVELDNASEDRELRIILAGASRRGDYQPVRKYIQENACQLRSLQLAEHEVNDLNAYQVKVPQLAQCYNSVGLN